MYNVIVIGPYTYILPIRGIIDTIHVLDFDIKDDYIEAINLIKSHHNEIDLVLFTGGEDVSPELYGGINKRSYVNKKRDIMEQTIFRLCYKYGIKVSGICRGFQFINVMSGGKMYQHMRHPPYHNAYFAMSNEQHLVSSTHHQLVNICESTIPIIWTEPSISPFYFDENGGAVKPKIKIKEVEGAIFTNIRGFGVQFHPEIMNVTDSAVIAYQTIMEDFLSYGFDKFVQLYRTKCGGAKCQKISLNC